MILLWACTGAELEAPTEATAEQNEERSDEQLAVGEVQVCSEPLDTVAYTEVGEAWGLTGNPGAEHGEGGSIAIDDFDDDGDLDVALAFLREPVRLFRRSGDQFILETIEALSHPAILSTADLDGDGKVDLIAGNYYGPTTAVVQRDGQLVALEGFPTLEMEQAQVKELAPGDFDGDGIVDLYGVVNGAPGTTLVDVLLHGLGGGAFEVVTDGVPAELSDRHGFDALWVDLDDDGTQEVYVVNDLGTGNAVFEVHDGKLVDGSTDCSCIPIHDGMGVDIGDFDRDGLPDLYLAASFRNLQLQGQADRSFVDVTSALNANPITKEGSMAWSAIWLDHDNDGWLDVAVAQGDLWTAQEEEDLPVFSLPLNLLRQVDGTFQDVAADLGMTELGSFRAVVAVDHNGDGVLDPLFSRISERPLLYMSDGCTADGWIEVAAPPGSKVEITAGDTTWTSWVTAASGAAAARPADVHVGVGGAERLDLVVTLPDGKRLEESNLAPNRRVSVISD